MERQSDYRDIKARIDENWVLSVIQQSCINTFRLAQASIRSAFRYGSIFNHIDHIRVFNCAEAVGDDEGGAALAESVERSLDFGFTLCVEGRCGFIQQKNWRVA